MREWPKNAKLFLVFRIFFNARYYYPVFAILFMDLGISLEQFALLNGLWAITIVLLEVPSGALADILGRLALVRLGAFLMVLEMLCLLVPRGDPALLLGALAVNRVLSGMAEALVSGADEALAYDSIEEDRETVWSQVLEYQMRYVNLAMVFAMLLGGAVYDPRCWFFLEPDRATEWALRAPVVLTLLHALVVVAIVLQMKAPSRQRERGWGLVSKAFRQTWSTGRWILTRRSVFLVIVATVFFDHLARQTLTVSSDYLTVVGIPEAVLGVFGAVVALASAVIAGPLKRTALQRSPAFMFGLVLAVLSVSCVGLARPIPYLSAVWVIAMGVVMGATNYLASLYLNQLVSEERRATLLSFKGLAVNLGYLWISLLYSGGLAARGVQEGEAPVVVAFHGFGPYAMLALVPVLFVALKTPDRGRQGGFGRPSHPQEPEN